MRVLIVLALCAAACASAQHSAPEANTAAAARRDLWLSDEGRFVRRWLALGPLSAAQAAFAKINQRTLFDLLM